MKFKQRKLRQRAVNKAIKRVNQTLCDDDLWLGRFRIRQDSSNWFSYYDKQGGTLGVKLTFVDLKTGKTVPYWAEAIHYIRFFESDLFWRMNKFVVEDCAVWSEDPPPNKNSVDFRGVK